MTRLEAMKQAVSNMTDESAVMPEMAERLSTLAYDFAKDVEGNSFVDQNVRRLEARIELMRDTSDYISECVDKVQEALDKWKHRAYGETCEEEEADAAC